MIHYLAIADAMGFRVKASYSEETLELRQQWEQVTTSVLTLAEGNYRVQETLPTGKARLLARKYDSEVHVVITTTDYPLWLAEECIDDLAVSDGSLFMSNKERYRQRLRRCVHVYHKYGKDEPGCLLYEMRNMGESPPTTQQMIHYTPELWEQRKEYVHALQAYLQSRAKEDQQKKLKQAQDKVDEMKDQMMMFMTTITLQNRVQGERLQHHAEELLQQAKAFRKTSAAFRKKTEWNSRGALGLACVGTMVVVASAGGAVALAIGREGLALVAGGAIVGGVLGYHFQIRKQHSH